MKTKFIITLVITVATLVPSKINAQNVDAAKYSPFYYQRASLFANLPVDSTNIVMLGNSITNGAEWFELFRNPKVINRGISGDTAGGVKDRLNSVTAGKPAKIFLLIGVNDISHGLSADSITAAIVDLVKTIRENTPDTKLYVQSILPIDNSFDRYKTLGGREQVLLDINKALPNEIENLGATWLDVFPLLADENGVLKKEFTNDGLHLLGSAYLIWRDFLLPYINE